MTISSIKNIGSALLFYAASVVIVFLLEKIAPSGPCNPGLGVLAFFVFVPVSAWLILKNVYQLLIKKDRENLPVVATHFMAAFFSMLVFKFICCSRNGLYV